MRVLLRLAMLEGSHHNGVSCNILQRFLRVAKYSIALFFYGLTLPFPVLYIGLFLSLPSSEDILSIPQLSPITPSFLFYSPYIDNIPIIANCQYVANFIFFNYKKSAKDGICYDSLRSALGDYEESRYLPVQAFEGLSFQCWTVEPSAQKRECQHLYSQHALPDSRLQY